MFVKSRKLIKYSKAMKILTIVIFSNRSFQEMNNIVRIRNAVREFGAKFVRIKNIKTTAIINL